MAVEWVSENIASFGGDPTKITLWGQSAGAMYADDYLFAFYEDPIIRASVSSSGVAGTAGNKDVTGTNFTFVAKSLGCDSSDPTIEIECMRGVPVAPMENFIGQYQDNSTLVDTSQLAISFGRQSKAFPLYLMCRILSQIFPVDNKFIFENYTERYLSGQIAPLPKILGTTAREASILVPYPTDNLTGGPSLDSIIDLTLDVFVCPSYTTSLLRDQLGLPTYRYQWAGNFSNIAPVDWLGAYHYSDLYMFFGTYLITPGELGEEDAELEEQTSIKMQDYLLAFMIDPDSLPGVGWPKYKALNTTTGGSLLRFGADGKIEQVINGNNVEGACHIPGVIYNTTP